MNKKQKSVKFLAHLILQSLWSLAIMAAFILVAIAIYRCETSDTLKAFLVTFEAIAVIVVRYYFKGKSGAS